MAGNGKSQDDLERSEREKGINRKCERAVQQLKE